MSWIKVRNNLSNHPHVVRIASALRAHPVQVMGALVHLWAQADAHANGESLPGMTFESLDWMVGLPDFAKELSKVGWIKEIPEGILLIDYEKHNGPNAKRRALEALRKQQDRANSEKSGKKANGHNADTKRTYPGHNADGLRTDAGRPQDEMSPHADQEIRDKSIRDKNKKNPPLSPFDPLSIPLPFPSAGFLEAWKDWIQHRREIKEPLTPVSVKKQFKQFGEWGEARSVVAIEHCIRGGYTGIFEPYPARQNGQAPKPTPSNGFKEAGDRVRKGETADPGLSALLQAKEQEDRLLTQGGFDHAW